MAVAAAIAACATPAPSNAAAGRWGRLDVVTRGDGRVLPTYAKDGRRWVVGAPGQEYALRVCNSTGGRLLAVMSVDGVNVITGDTASPVQSGYVLAPWECTDVAGWRKSLAHTASFYFTELPDAYAARTGRPENVGVIGVAFFAEKPRPRAWLERSAGARDEVRADAPSARHEAQAAADAASAPAAEGAAARGQAAPMPPAPLAKLGTGHGRTESSPTELVDFERASATPAETIAIHYDRRENLVAMGILPPPVVARVPNAFPAWTPRFVPDPPAR